MEAAIPMRVTPRLPPAQGTGFAHCSAAKATAVREARELNDDAVLTLALDQRLGDAELVHAVADDLHRADECRGAPELIRHIRVSLRELPDDRIRDREELPRALIDDQLLVIP